MFGPGVKQVRSTHDANRRSAEHNPSLEESILSVVANRPESSTRVITRVLVVTHMCCQFRQGSQEPIFITTNLGYTQQGCQKTNTARLAPFPDLLDPKICHQSSLSGIIWDA
ncbi:hypothetical protein TNCV_1555981 [Trichonephila clavipes]|nr:hypothetical protein TNCV_1555981 [Trichonephila clavipes]